jgi:hypothetical protein
MKTPVALFISALLTIVGCNTVDLSELPAQEELRVGPVQPAPQKAGGSDDSIKPALKPVVIQKGGIPDDTIKPVQPIQRGGGVDDSIRPVQKDAVPTPVRAPR